MHVKFCCQIKPCHSEIRNPWPRAGLQELSSVASISEGLSDNIVFRASRARAGRSTKSETISKSKCSNFETAHS